MSPNIFNPFEAERPFMGIAQVAYFGPSAPKTAIYCFCIVTPPASDCGFFAPDGGAVLPCSLLPDLAALRTMNILRARSTWSPDTDRVRADLTRLVER